MELPTAVKDNIACWLSDTAGPDEGAMRTATLHLEGAQTAPKFALCLLELAAGITFYLRKMTSPTMQVIMCCYLMFQYILTSYTILGKSGVVCITFC